MMPMGTAGPEPQIDFSALVVAVAQRQDKQAFAQLFQHYAPRVKSYLIRHGADGGQAEEVVQETMLRPCVFAEHLPSAALPRSRRNDDMGS